MSKFSIIMNPVRMMRWLYATACCAILLVVGACSQEVKTSLLDTVPSSAPVVAVADVELLLKRAGCSFDGGTVQLSPQLRKIADTPAESSSAVAASLRIFADLYGAVDLSEVVFVGIDPGQNSNDTFFTFMVSDKGAVVAKMEALGVKDTATEPDYQVYAGDEWTLAMHGDQGWLISAGTDSDKARSYFTAPDRKESIGAQTGIVDFLNTDNAINVAVSINSDNDGRRACVGVKVEDTVMGMSMQLVAPDGSVSDFAAPLQEVSTDFLRYVPASYIGAAAIGFTPDFDWSALGSLAALVGGRDVSTMMQMAIPFLSKIDGTLAVAAGPAGGAPAIADINLRTWNLMVMAHMQQADVDATLAQIAAMAPQIGAVPVKMESNPLGLSAWRMPDGTELYAGNVDGCLTLSNREPVADGENSMTDTFLSQRAAMAVNIPAGSEVVKAFNLPWGFNVSMQCGKSQIDVRFSLNGTDRSVFQALLEQIG